MMKFLILLLVTANVWANSEYAQSDLNLDSDNEEIIVEDDSMPVSDEVYEEEITTSDSSASDEDY
ncbi:MAG: hypothetical protein CME62_12645 [Halobacteriovoraceae bacterium]|nr:hypothetical protein [Halobacteriovoraceae bacterium]|tara:strand:+ start:23200 stop:23394 length:195 start_codon:yes stop_codon:yes gene_type:complete